MELTRTQVHDIETSVLTAVRIVAGKSPEDKVSLDSRFSDIGFDQNQVKSVFANLEAQYVHSELDLNGFYNKRSDFTDLMIGSLVGYIQGYLAEGFDSNDSLYQSRLSAQLQGATN